MTAISVTVNRPWRNRGAGIQLRVSAAQGFGAASVRNRRVYESTRGFESAIGVRSITLPVRDKSQRFARSLTVSAQLVRASPVYVYHSGS